MSDRCTICEAWNGQRHRHYCSKEIKLRSVNRSWKAVENISDDICATVFSTKISKQEMRRKVKRLCVKITEVSAYAQEKQKGVRNGR